MKQDRKISLINGIFLISKSLYTISYTKKLKRIKEGVFKYTNVVKVS